MSTGNLSGRRILVVEDQFMQARETRNLLESAGAEVVGPTGHPEDVPSLLKDGKIDAALLDINLGQGPNYDVADDLRRRGVPFVFLTGYDSGVIPEEHADAPRLAKPVSPKALIGMLARLV